jgi:hypothetical protein
MATVQVNGQTLVSKKKSNGAKPMGAKKKDGETPEATDQVGLAPSLTKHPNPAVRAIQTFDSGGPSLEDATTFIDEVETALEALKDSMRGKAQALRKMADRWLGTLEPSPTATVTKKGGKTRAPRTGSIDPEKVIAAMKALKATSKATARPVSEIANSMAVDKAKVAPALKKLQGEDKAKLVGKKRNAKWHLA